MLPSKVFQWMKNKLIKGWRICGSVSRLCRDTGPPAHTFLFIFSITDCHFLPLIHDGLNRVSLSGSVFLSKKKQSETLLGVILQEMTSVAAALAQDSGNAHDSKVHLYHSCPFILNNSRSPDLLFFRDIFHHFV